MEGSDYCRILKIDNLNKYYDKQILMPLYRNAGKVELIYNISKTSVIIVFDLNCDMDFALKITKSLCPTSKTEVISDSKMRGMKGRTKVQECDSRVDNMLDEILEENKIVTSEKKIVIIEPSPRFSMDSCSSYSSAAQKDRFEYLCTPGTSNNNDQRFISSPYINTDIKSPPEGCKPDSTTTEILSIKKEEVVVDIPIPETFYHRPDPRSKFPKIGIRPDGELYNPRNPSFPPPRIDYYMEAFRAGAFLSLANYMETSLQPFHAAINNDEQVIDIDEPLNLQSPPILEEKYMDDFLSKAFSKVKNQKRRESITTQVVIKDDQNQACTFRGGPDRLPDHNIETSFCPTNYKESDSIQSPPVDDDKMKNLSSEFDLRYKLNISRKISDIRARLESRQDINPEENSSLSSISQSDHLSSCSLSFSSFSEDLNEEPDRPFTSKRYFKKSISPTNDSPKRKIKRYKEHSPLDKSIYFTNFPSFCKKGNLFQFFKHYGYILNIEIEDTHHGKNAVSGLVDFGSVEAVSKAIKLNNTMYEGRRIGIYPKSRYLSKVASSAKKQYNKTDRKPF